MFRNIQKGKSKKLKSDFGERNKIKNSFRHITGSVLQCS